jgi:3-deoxy-D-manno-octulosonic-acid transferase
MMKNGVHNVLEAAVYGKVVLFGPYYQKYTEAIGLVNSGGGISFTDEAKNGKALGVILENLAGNENEYTMRSKAAGEFVQSHRGATDKILAYIQEKRLLTN